MANTHIPVSPLNYLMLAKEVEDFFYREADLLDERRYEEWLTIFTDDVRYWMPIRKNVPYRAEHGDMTDENDIAWIDDDKTTLTKRVRQIQTGVHWAEEPASRICHIISNIRLLEAPGTENSNHELAVTSRFCVYRNRVETETDFLVGRRHDMLRRVDGRLMVARRKIILDQSVLMAKNLTMFF
ncbi:MAG TPA: 3-phenylpropionate/cinnamic acid dioxygenase subunit beta [Candidatus Binataceae bacterium]|nr:3-phenylpropionate/cinnamic acid dioxygenase subunit beta [Candidatus Binataceae bacterium]